MDQEPASTDNKKQLMTTLAVLLVIVVIVGGAIFITQRNEDEDTNSATTSQQDSNTSNDSSDQSSGSYKDGSYTATGSYISPGGDEDITVTVTLENGVITQTSAKSGAHSSEGKEFQSQFISGYKERVVGKNIDDIKLSQVSGSSLTSQGFNDALDKIKEQAEA